MLSDLATDSEALGFHDRQYFSAHYLGDLAILRARHLEQLARDTDPKMRAYAELALTRGGDEAHLDRLEELASSEDVEARLIAIYALASWGKRAALSQLVDEADSLPDRAEWGYSLGQLLPDLPGGEEPWTLEDVSTRAQRLRAWIEENSRHLTYDWYTMCWRVVRVARLLRLDVDPWNGRVLDCDGRSYTETSLRRLAHEARVSDAELEEAIQSDSWMRWR